MIASLAALLLAASAPSAAYDGTTAERCRATPWEQLDDSLKEACSSFGVLLVDHLARQLIADDRAFAILCQGPAAGAARAADLDTDLGCLLAEAERTEAAVAALQADLPALEQRCTETTEADRDPVLTAACANRAKARLSADIARLTTDAEAYAQTCARFGDAPVDLSHGDLADAQIACEHARYRRATGIDPPRGWTAYAPLGDVAEIAAPVATSSSLTELATQPVPGDGSPFDRAAREAAAAIIAKAKASPP